MSYLIFTATPMNSSLLLRLAVLLLLIQSLGVDCPDALGQANKLRKNEEDLNAPEVRSRQGLQPGSGLLFNGWGITPAGSQVQVSDMPLKMIVAPDKKTILAVSGGFRNPGLTLLDLHSKRVSQFLPIAEAWNGLTFSKDGRHVFVTGGDFGQIYAFSYRDGKATQEKSGKPSPDASRTFLAGIIAHPSNGELYVCNEGNHEIWVVDSETLQLETTVAVGMHPHSCILGADKRHLYVSNWGSRSVSVVDTEKNRRISDISVGLRPNDLVLAPDGRLFVACAGDNTVQVIQTRAVEKPGEEPSPERRLWEGTREIISTSLYPQSPEGSTPNGVAISPDGRTLFIANADNNNVMVVDISEPAVSRVEGFIPVGWYPTAVLVSPDNQSLLVANGKGLSRANYPAQTETPRKLHKPPPFDYIGHTFDGSISFISRPDAPEMGSYTEQVRRNSPYRPESLQRTAMRSKSVIPDRVGQPCPIKYVIYIIRENRTYDQVFGDFKDAKGRPAGNGDPNLAIYGEKVTPNQHQLARDFILLDNLYCNGEVSVDGHSWCDAAIATDYTQRSWIRSYSRHGRLPGNDEMEVPAAGYLWDLCRRHGVSYKNYGEGARRVPSTNRGKWVGQRDPEKAQCWIEDLKQAEKTGVFPQFTIMSLGENHTRGTTPGAFTPDACVASNDQALGMIVQAAMRSRFWPEMAIFVIEDDAQNGPDHVDAHRTAGLVISPYCKRGFIDSTLYTTASMIRTMELILGLPPLTQYDAGATPMFNCFQKSPISNRSYTLLPAQVDLTAKNTAKSPYAKQSKKMDWSDYDRAPEDELNRILWYVAKGPNVPYPTPIHRAVIPEVFKPSETSEE
jgi:YVTN family beta-propeller protein